MNLNQSSDSIFDQAGFIIPNELFAFTSTVNGYSPYFNDNDKFTHVFLTTTGAGMMLEASSHELAHILDLVQRKKFGLLLKQDYGMSFDDLKVPNFNKAVEVETRVITIQAKLLAMGGYTWNDIFDLIKTLVDGFTSIPALQHATNHPQVLDVMNAADQIEEDGLRQAWNTACDFLLSKR